MKTLVNVAVAVIYFEPKAERDAGREFLLARRHNHQHQGGKLEFVGGKIELNESETIALIREVGEELGLDIKGNFIQKLGDIFHDYGDKMVKLCVHSVALNESQAIEFKQKKYGIDGQSLYWLSKNELLARIDDLPKANVQILEWV